MSKEILYYVMYTGEDGRGKFEEEFVSKSETERDNFWCNMDKRHQMYCVKIEKIVDLQKVYEQLTLTEKLSIGDKKWYNHK